jgi:hypothetical protein
MAQDADKAIVDRKEELLNQQLNNFMDTYYKSKGDKSQSQIVWNQV